MSVFTLLRWLGPWTDQNRAPHGVVRTEIATDTSFPIWVYNTPQSRGAIYIVPGLHHEGPSDPRLDRFARVLAAAGITVGVPFLPTSMGLMMKPSLCSEAYEGFVAFHKHVDRPCGIFGISAASIGALALAADERLQKSISGVMLFGGFSHWKQALLFAATGGDLPRDPLNLPVIFLNLWKHMDVKAHDEPRLLKAWVEFIHLTWEKEEMRPFSTHVEVASRIAQTVHPKDKDIFLMGTSVKEGGIAYVEKALDVEDASYAWLAPQQYLSRISVPLYLTHGRDDVVVPFAQSYELQRMAPKDTPTYITGFYDHTGVTVWRRLLSLIPRIPQEIFHSIQLLRKMISISRPRKR